MRTNSANRGNEALERRLRHGGLPGPSKSLQPHQPPSTASVMHMAQATMRWHCKGNTSGCRERAAEIFTAKFWERNINHKVIAGHRVERQERKQVRVAVLNKVSCAEWARGWASGCGQPTTWVNEEAQGLQDYMSAGTRHTRREAGTWHFSNGLWPEEFEETTKMIE